jgi:hypothetical protein
MYFGSSRSRGIGPKSFRRLGSRTIGHHPPSYPFYPELVITGRDGYKSVEYAKVGPILVEAIKAQQKVIEDLTRRLERLEGERRGE